jgi:hypothetical protein
MRPTVCSVRQRQALRRRARSLNGRVHLVEHGVELVELRSQLLLGHGRRGGGVAAAADGGGESGGVEGARRQACGGVHGGGGAIVWRGGERGGERARRGSCDRVRVLPASFQGAEGRRHRARESRAARAASPRAGS